MRSAQSQTAPRKSAIIWPRSKGIVGVYIHNLKDDEENQSAKGRNPFDGFTVDEDKIKLSSIVKAYDPPYSTSTYVYNDIKEHLESWVEEAITIRNSQ